MLEAQEFVPRVLLIGYNGANNTGAEALLLSDLADIRAVLGSQVPITIPSLSVANLRRYLKESPYQHIVALPTIFPLTVWRLVRQHDFVMLVEGSAYMDTWTSALLWYFLWTTHCAHRMHKPCLAYAVDAGDLSPLNRRLVCREASKTNFIITRSRAAADRLRNCGVSAPIEATADNAFNFCPDVADENYLRNVWPESVATSGRVGLAVVDFYLWPVVLRLWGKKGDCYKWPYYFSRSPERAQGTAALVQGYAALADHMVTAYNKSVALIAMEQLDEALARQIQDHMQCAHGARVFSSATYNASQMTVLLRSLDLLVTSRYHASVLSMAAHVPQMALGHDLRLKNLYLELGLYEAFFVDHRMPDLFAAVSKRVEQLLTQPNCQQDTLRRGYAEHVARAKRNRELLRTFVQAQGWRVAG